MSSGATAVPGASYPVDVCVEPAIGDRDRLTTFFRLLLAIPHLLLVGGPMGATFVWWAFTPDDHPTYERGSSGGVIGVAAIVASIIAWFAILFTGRYPESLYGFGVGVFRWSTRVEAYLLLLHDAYPPFTLS